MDQHTVYVVFIVAVAVAVVVVVALLSKRLTGGGLRVSDGKRKFEANVSAATPDAQPKTTANFEKSKFDKGNEVKVEGNTEASFLDATVGENNRFEVGTPIERSEKKNKK